MTRIIKITMLLCFINSVINAQVITIKNAESKLITHQGVEFTGKLIDKTKDLHMFPTWKNNGVIFLDGKKYRLSNINLNVSTNKIDSEIKGDKFFVYRASLVDSVLINNRSFKRLGRSFYEVLLETNDNLFLKKFDVKFKESSAGRLGVSSKSKKSLKYSYLIKSNDLFKHIELNKKSVVAFFEGKEDELYKFVKEEKLSYKKEKDLIKIIDFMLNKTS